MGRLGVPHYYYTYILLPRWQKCESAPGSWNRSFRSAPLLLNTPASVGGAEVGGRSLCTGRSGRKHRQWHRRGQESKRREWARRRKEHTHTQLPANGPVCSLTCRRNKAPSSSAGTWRPPSALCAGGWASSVQQCFFFFFIKGSGMGKWGIPAVLMSSSERWNVSEAPTCSAPTIVPLGRNLKLLTAMW